MVVILVIVTRHVFKAAIIILQRAEKCGPVSRTERRWWGLGCIAIFLKEQIHVKNNHGDIKKCTNQATIPPHCWEIITQS